ncbi:MAG: hemerythrin domain-containing protein [Elusimicrobiota bacterium]
MDVIENLIAGHREVFEKKDLLAKLAASINNDAFFWDNVPKIQVFFNKEVKQHFELEEKVLFPEMKKIVPKEDQGKIAEIENEHKPILEIIAQLDGAMEEHSKNPNKSTRERVADVAGRLMEKLIPHAQKEDAELFPMVRKYFKAGNFIKLEAAYFKFLGV